MALSQADFYAFSQATGTQVPEDAAGRAQLAPYVLEWRRSQLKQPSQEGEGSNLLQTVGSLAAAAGLGTAAVLGARRLARGVASRSPVQPVNVQVQDQAVRRAAQPVPKLTATLGGQPGPDTARPPIPRQPTPSSPPQDFPDPFGGGTVPKAANPGVQTVSTRALPPAEPEYAPYAPGTKDPTYLSRFYVAPPSTAVKEARRKAATENLITTVRNTDPYQFEIPGVDATLMALRSPAGALAEETGELILKGESRPLSAAPAQQNLFAYVREAAEPQGDVTDRLVVELNQRRSLVDDQQAKQGFNVDQAINALDSGEDQMTGRMRQQLQRNEGTNLSVIDQLEDTTGSIDVAASMTPDGVPVDQAETGARMQGPVTAQEQLDLAKTEMIARRQDLEARGLRPGTMRFERELAQPFRTSQYTQMKGTGGIETALPSGPIRQTVEAVSASEPLIERSLPNVGPDALITSTAAGTAIRGKSPSYQTSPAKEERRQLFGTSDVSVPGAPDELGQDIPGSARVRGIAPQLEEGEALSKQEVIYSALDRPATTEPPGGSPGTGIYGVKLGYVEGPSSAAASQKPTYVPAFLQKREAKTGFEGLSTEQLTSGAAKAQGRVKTAFENELKRRENTEASLQASEALRRARIEGRDPQSVLRSLGFGV